MENFEEPARKRIRVQSETNVDTLIVRFPHVAGKIFAHLDLKTLLNCTAVSRSWNYFINDTKKIWIPHLETPKNSMVSCDVFNTLYLPFLVAFPEWEAVFNHFETSEHPKFIKKFVTFMHKYITVDFTELNKCPLTCQHHACANFGAKKCPLFYAAAVGPQEFLELMILAPIKFRHGLLFLMLQNSSKSNRIVKLMLMHAKEKDLKVDSKDRRGRNLFHIVCQTGNDEMVKYLLKHHADTIDINDWFQHGSTPIYEAAKNGNASTVRLLLDQSEKYKVNYNIGTAGFVQLPLHIACENGHFEVVKAILEWEKVNVNARTGMLDDRRSAFDLACLSKEPEIMKLLLQRPELEVIFDKDPFPLHIASKLNDSKLLATLLKRAVAGDGFQVSLPKDKDGNTPHMIACKEGRFENLKILLMTSPINFGQIRALGQTNKKGETILELACNQKDPRILSQVLDAMNYSRFCFTSASEEVKPFNIACKNGYVEHVQLILKCYKPREPHWLVLKETLLCALQKKQSEVAKLLLNLNTISVDKVALHEACEIEDSTLLEKILTKIQPSDLESRNSNKEGRTPLLTAVMHRNIQHVRVLLDNGAYIHARDFHGDTSAHLAVAKSDSQILNLLISRGINVNERNKKGETPLLKALDNENMDCFQLLVSQPDIDVLTYKFGRFGSTYIHEATEKGNSAAVQLLIARNIDVNRSRIDGFTPLHIACERGDDEMVRVLLQHENIDINAQIARNTNINGRTRRGFTPLHIACERGNDEVVRVLLQHDNIDINAQDIVTLGDSPLHVACLNNKVDVVKMLIVEPSINVNCRNGQGYSPLHFACERGNNELVQALLEHEDIEINAQDTNSQTPLRKAAATQNFSTMQILLDYARAKNVDIKDHSYIKL